MTHPLNMTAQQDQRYDVAIIGGGAAGLSGALTLARARRSVVVIDAGQPRNAPAAHMHGYLSRDGLPPADLLAIGREEVLGYGAQIVEDRVVSAERTDEGAFLVTLAGGDTVVAARLLVTTGLVDELPQVPGVAERWGRDVAHCPYCHGWEVRDQAIGILGTSPMSVHQAHMWRQWSKDVTLFMHELVLSPDEQVEMTALGIAVQQGRVAGLEVNDDVLTGVVLADGKVVPRQVLVVAPRFTAQVDALKGLGLEPVDQVMGGSVVGTYLAADPSGATAVPGVWVAGNVTSLMDQVIGAAGAGARAGAAINADLIAEETRRAVEALTMTDFWDARYSQSEQIWSGNPNALLVTEATPLEPGTALDLGSGEGGDAIWLAARGWHVTGTDISQVALDRAARHATEAGVADRITWEQHDLGVSFPEGTFDLVSAQFLHSWGDMPRDQILRTAAAAVAPGGILLIVSHAGSAEGHGHSHVRFPTPQEVLDGLELVDGEWEVLRSEEVERPQTGPADPHGHHADNIVKLRRRP